MGNVTYAARKLAASNLGWFLQTRRTLGEASGNERAININKPVLDDWFPALHGNTALDVTARYLDGTDESHQSITSDERTIRLQGGGKNWRLAGDAIQGELYDVREDDILFMAFDRSKNILSWIVIKGTNSPDRLVDTQELAAYSNVRRLLGPDKGSMWVVPTQDASEIIEEIKTIYSLAGELLMQYKAMSETWIESLKAVGYGTVQSVDRRLLSSILTKPFVILTGLSGSGKTLLAREFVRWCVKDPSQYALVPVGANWTSSDHILGYPDALDSSRYVKTEILNILLKAEADPEVPYFIVLDEMNLSQVERYFADFLSAIETPDEPIILHGEDTSRDGIPNKLASLPRNLFIIGTVNVDETTYLFSPKVLDRANVIEFKASSDAMERFLIDSSVKKNSSVGRGQSFGKTLISSQKKLINLSDLKVPLRTILKDELLLLFETLAEEGSEFGFRTAKEIIRYFWFAVEMAQPLSDDDTLACAREALDQQILQKILPRINGSRRKIEPLLLKLQSYTKEDRQWDPQGLANKNQVKTLISQASNDLNGTTGPDVNAVFLPMSNLKIVNMLNLVRANGFVSFAEG